MRLTKMLVTLALVLLLGACGPAESRNSLFTEKNLVFDPALLGTWVGESDIIIFERLGDKGYKAIYRDIKNRDQSTYQAQLGRLGEFLFMDVVTEEPEAKEKPNKVHMFFRVWVEGKAMGVAALDDDWVKEMIASGRVELGYKREGQEGNDIVLTASTVDLQHFVVKYAEDEKAFPEPAKFRRQE